MEAIGLNSSEGPKAVPPDPAPIVALHGTADQVIPLGPTAGVVKRLQDRGWPARLERFEGVRHEIPPPMYREVQTLTR